MENKMTEKRERTVSVPVVILAISVVIAAAVLVQKYGNYPRYVQNNTPSAAENDTPSNVPTLSVRFGDLGPRLVSSGVIDREKFLRIYDGSEDLKKEAQKLLDGADNGNFTITEENSPVVLNFLWALGLGNKNAVLEQGPMMDPRYGGAGNFASTGGWTIARGSAMDHYSMHSFIVLTPTEQELVERVSKNIYRPCCDNSTYFPDCNHGMAMLGFLEFMAKEGVSESDMYRFTLMLNMYWFPGAYATVAEYAQSEGIDWNNMLPKEVLGSEYSSASGFRNISSQIKNTGGGGGSGCSV